MKRALAFIDRLSELSGKGLSALIFAMIGILLIEVVLRYVFNRPTIWAHETTQQVFGAYAVLAGAYTLLHAQHAKVDIIYAAFSPRGRAIADCVTFLFTFVYLMVILVLLVVMVVD